MATYLDILSASANEDDDNLISNETLELINSSIFSNVDYVTLIMDYKRTGQFDNARAKKVIMQAWKQSKGSADMTSCCRAFAETLDNFMVLAKQLAPLFRELIDKYDEQ